MTEKKKQIMVIDDDPFIRDLIGTILIRTGFSVIKADSGTEALRMIENAAGLDTDLFLVDFVLPGVSGQDLVRAIVPRFPDARIIIMSGYPEQVLDDDLFAKSIHSFIKKPFTAGTLIDLVSRQLQTATDKTA